MKKLLVVDDTEQVHEAVHLILDGKFEIFSASCRREALSLFNLQEPDVILLDIEFNAVPEGWEILKEIRQKDRDVPIFIMSANGFYREHPLVSETNGFIEKPFSLEAFTKVLNGKEAV